MFIDLGENENQLRSKERNGARVVKLYLTPVLRTEPEGVWLLDL
jgi:hypothetical protein